MDGGFGIVLLYMVGTILLVAEIFLPSHGILAFVSLAMLGYALYQTFQVSDTAGMVAVLILAVFIPTVVVVAVRNWHRTPVGRRISPPNPVLSKDDKLPVEGIAAFIGKVGRSITPLRPVGTCIFDGRRVECMAEHGMIEVDVEVEGVELKDRSLAVRPVSGSLPKDTQEA